jgi:hypothetical protein
MSSLQAACETKFEVLDPATPHALPFLHNDCMPMAVITKVCATRVRDLDDRTPTTPRVSFMFLSKRRRRGSVTQKNATQHLATSLLAYSSLVDMIVYMQVLRYKA